MSSSVQSELFLIIDQGGHSSRAMVFDAQGVLAFQAQQAVTTRTLQTGWIEQDPLQIIHSVRSAVELLVGQLGDRCAAVVAAGMIVQRSSLVAWNRETGEALYPVLSWQDTRNSCWLEEHIHHQRNFLRAQTGLQPNAHYGASKMRWLLDHVAAVQQAAADGVLCLSPLASYLHWHLTTSVTPVVDPVIAARTLLTESAACQWSSTLLDFFAIPIAVLPAIQPTVADYGEVMLGAHAVPLRLMGGDQSFVALAYGDAHADAVFINAGTGAFIQQLCAADRVPASLLCASLVIDSDHHSITVAEATVNAAASALDWLWGNPQFNVEGVVLDAEALETALQATATADFSVPFFINRIAGSGSPDWLPAGDSYFSRAADLPVLAVAVLESIVFSLQRNLDVMKTVLPCERIIISGGLSRLAGFCQRLSNLSGVSVLRSDDTEASGRGAALCLISSHSGEPVAQDCLAGCQIFMPVAQPDLQSRFHAWRIVMDELMAGCVC